MLTFGFAIENTLLDARRAGRENSQDICSSSEPSRIFLSHAKPDEKICWRTFRGPSRSYFSTKHQHAVQRLIQSSTRSLCSGTIARSSFREVVVSPLGPLTEVDFWTICRLFHGCIQTYYCNEIHIKFKTSIFQHFSRSTRSSPYHSRCS